MGNRLFDMERLTELEKSRKPGCRMCLFLKNVLLNQIETNVSRNAGSLQLILSEFHPDLGTVRFAITPQLWLPSHTTGEFRIGEIARPINIWAEHETNGRCVEFLDPDQTSNEILDRIKTYINICAQNHNDHHSECQYTDQISAPLRLLNVKNPETVRIEDTDGNNLQYAILRYCSPNAEWHGPSNRVSGPNTRIEH